jgi:outer membrane protein assembly factor BamA
LRKFILLLFFVCGPGQAQTADTLRVRQIILVGNDKTREQIILREMKTKEGDLYHDELVEKDRMAIQNMQLFTRVEIHPIPVEGGVDLLVILAEQWYIFPYFIFNLNDRSWDKLSYGLGLAHKNVAGRNIHLNAAFWLGYNPGASFSYANPWISGTRNLYSQIAMQSQKVANQSAAFPDFDESQQAASALLGKRWGLHTYASVEAGYRRVATPAELHAGLSPNGVDRFGQAGLQFTYDRRDLHEYPKDGWYLSLSARASYNGQAVHFQKYGFDLRRYQPVYGAVSLAGRVAANISAGAIPVYERYFIGLQERIRGYFSEQSEGRQRIVAGLELRFPLLPIRYFDFGNSESALGSFMNNLPFGVSAALFCDTGTVWDQLSHLHRQKFKQGFGAGVHIHLPYVNVLRLEYAFDQQGHGEFITDLYVWF